MRILQLCKKFPYPLKDGEAVAVTYLAQAMAKAGVRIDLCAMNTRKHWVNIEQHRQEMRHYTRIKTCFVDNHIYRIAAFRNLFSNRSFHIQRFNQPAFAETLQEMLETATYDVIQLESVYMIPYLSLIRKKSQALVVLRTHNVENEIWGRVAQNSSGLKKWYLRLQTARLRRYEEMAIRQCDLLVAISHRDLRTFYTLGLKKPAMVLPIGLDLARYSPQSLPSPAHSIAFLGSMDWIPNLEGLNWFIQTIWMPHFSNHTPGLHFHIAGRNAPERWKHQTTPGVVFHGEVDSASAFLLQHPVVVVPLLSGGGMRAKILEAVALGRLVITTTVGLEGIELMDGTHCLVADTPAAFAQAIHWCLQNPSAMQKMADAGRSELRQRYDLTRLTRSYLETCEKLVSEDKTSPNSIETQEPSQIKNLDA
jgi:glycosyltransferase involved in cell wall biosynthesis